MLILHIILLIICIIPTLIIIVDLYHNINIWQKRIHIGRWRNIEDWENAIENRALKWLKRVPIVSQKGSNKYILLDIIKGNYKNSTIQSWQKAGLLMGLNVFEDNIPQNCHIDASLLGYAILNNHPAPDNIKPKLDIIYHKILETKGNNETIPYRHTIPCIRFVDTIGLVCPFLVKYGLTYNIPEAITLAERQIREYASFISPTTKTPPHAYNIKNKVPLGVYDWGRGIGWYILGIIECYSHLYDCCFKDFLKDQIIQLSQYLLKYQLKSGGFSASIFDDTSFGESSSTVLCGLLFNMCYKITQDYTYFKATDKVIAQLIKNTQRNGAIDLCQGDTHGLGNYSMCFGYMPFVQGLTLVLIKRHKNENA